MICHGGLGTVLRALAHGIPLLMAPLGRDQAFNASGVEDLGAGIRLPRDAPEERIRAAVALQRVVPRAAVREAEARAAADAPDIANLRGILAQMEAAARRIAADQPERTAARALERAAHR